MQVGPIGDLFPRKRSGLAKVGRWVEGIALGQSRVIKVKAAKGWGGKSPGGQRLGGLRVKRESPLF